MTDTDDAAGGPGQDHPHDLSDSESTSTRSPRVATAEQQECPVLSLLAENADLDRLVSGAHHDP
ncbi:hypothetical protein, partial [Frankia sp. CiP3]